MSRNIIFVLMYHRHKLLDLITVEHGAQMVETHIYVSSEVLLVMNIKFMVFWAVPPYSLIDGYKLSRAIHFLTLKGGGMKMEAVGSFNTGT
jgi:hypothetical protein